VGLIRRDWTPGEANEWTKEDTVAVILSPLVYVLILVGCALSVLLIPAGFLILLAGIVLLFVMIHIIDPKLSAISEDYEQKQKEYIEELERKVKWED
jgi:hypothetical protein